ncbi:Oidioi.mRNA.OKI2018_I69.PAR.g9149.t1.cds [Oikopleura dioica]|uniref:Oidioi.mRNA.OKI2018_I69.PAR.g9149.t1.cds n=1 Tax=Oikopleura dioica TaxID=34765 RepID=A0ABN7RMS8_OIKDI|nr:Oidioi.mRNA.OKI2018_I69.PAR.g9149.t1.cds [Oikopleura dioica]
MNICALTICLAKNPMTKQCELAEPSCVQLKCAPTEMIIFLRKELFDVDFDFVCQDSKTTETDSGWLLTVPLGACGMQAEHVGDHIRFQLVIKATDDEKEVFFQSDFKPQVTTTCNFKSQATIKSSRMFSNSLSDLSASSDQTIYSWEKSVSLKFKNGESGEEPLHFGDEILVETEWAQSVRKNFPVDFSLKNCYVESENGEFEIIRDGCPARIVNGKLENSLRQKTLRWKSFSFQEKNHEPQKLRCTVSFCLRDNSCLVKTC